MNIIKFDVIDSTNTWALENFDKLEDKTLVSANMQTNGRGRFQRVWVSEDCENIYLSFVLKPEKTDYIANLTQYLSVVTAKVLKNFGIPAQIKWANDVLVNNKKIAGILCESSMKNNVIEGVVLGIGINLNMPAHIIEKIDKPATSLSLEIEKNVDKEDFLNKLVEEFFKDYDEMIEKGFSFIKSDYLGFANFLGKPVKINTQTSCYYAKSINSSGNLIVIDEDGNEKTILSGDLLF
jgi:BirA family biotin operon repressor/biotin-[acetyl-CoA-carboxylase] ligase